MTEYQHLGPEHPKVLSAAAAFDTWWEKYQPVAYLTETILTKVPEGVDPESIWTEFDGEYDESFFPGLHQSGRDDVSGYWFTSLPCSEGDKGTMVITEVRQYCEGRDQASREGVACSDCPMAAGLCSGSGNQWCEIPNIRYPGGAPAYSLEELVGMIEQGPREDAETMKNHGKTAFQRGDVATARDWWEKAAARGSTDAMSNLGVLAQNENNPALAQEWFQKAADSGNAVAMYNLGNIAYGNGDREAAQIWWERADVSGHPTAANNLRALASESGPGERRLESDDLSEARAQFETWARHYDRVFWTADFRELEEKGVPEKLIWTVLDDNDGSCVVTNGVAPAGRMAVVGYHVTRRPWTEGDNLVIISDVNVQCAVCATSGEVDGETCQDCEGMGDIWVDLDDNTPTDSSVLDVLK
jgi:hypothetical protein